MAPKSPAGFLYNFIGRGAAQAADPRNYQFLQRAAGDVLSRVKKVQLPLPFQMPSEGMLGPSSPLGQITARTSMFARNPQNLMRGGIDTAKGILGKIPTAINPLATKTPTTLLGKVGQVFNPLNPANLLDAANPMPGISAGARLAQSLGIAGTTPGLLTTVGGGLAAYGAFDALFPDSVADGTLEGAKLPKRGPAMFADAFPFGGDASIRDKEGRVWAGRNYGFQSPESFRKLYGANVGIAPGSLQPPEAPAPPALLDPGLQAGQLTPPSLAPRVPPGVVSNGAGAPAQRQNVQERALSQEVLNAAQQYSAPAGVPLSSFYAGQQQLGRRMEQGGELQRRLKDLGAFAGMSDQALMDWTRQNPGLAYRELMKLQARNPQM